MTKTTILSTIFFVAIVMPLAGQKPADMVVINAHVYTVDPTSPIAEAFAIADGRFQFVGGSSGAMALADAATRVIDLGGRTVIPGMIDAHGHLTGLAAFLRSMNLTGTGSFDEVVEMVEDRVALVQPGDWITGRGWDQNDWADHNFPTHADLNRVAPRNPVILQRVDGHAVIANDMALVAAGITAATDDPEGGRIIRDADGVPTGVLIDAAADTALSRVPKWSPREHREALLTAVELISSHGLTGVHDAGAGLDSIAVFEELARAGQLDLRIYFMVSTAGTNIETSFSRGPQNDLYGGRIWIRAIKISSDGALGSRGAAMLEPYADDPGNTGLITFGHDRILDVASRALEAGFQVNVHAIGDRANRDALDAFETALAANPVADHRFRIEHAQILSDRDIPRFADLNVIPSMQGTHQTSDMYWAVERVGETRIRGAYAWRSLLDTGVIIPNGSDFPVEQVNPLLSFHSFVTRHDSERWPAGGWFPEQRTTREEALLSVTLWPAYAGFMENDVGSITPGKYADFVVLDRDLMTVDEHEIIETTVLQTYLGGELVYTKD